MREEKNTAKLSLIKKPYVAPLSAVEVVDSEEIMEDPLFPTSWNPGHGSPNLPIHEGDPNNDDPGAKEFSMFTLWDYDLWGDEEEEEW